MLYEVITVLYVTDTISIGSGGGKSKNEKAPPQIHIAPGASLTIYMAGATTTIGGNGVVNDSQEAKNFQYYGLPSNRITSYNVCYTKLLRGKRGRQGLRILVYRSRRPRVESVSFPAARARGGETGLRDIVQFV